MYNLSLFTRCFFFLCRDFIARHTLRVEFGLANEMDQLDRNFKLRQVMGAPAPSLATQSIGSPFRQSIRAFTEHH